MLPPMGRNASTLPSTRGGAEDVQVELLVEVLVGDALERGELVDAGIVHQDVEPAERLLRLGEQALDVRLRATLACTAMALPPWR